MKLILIDQSDNDYRRIRNVRALHITPTLVQEFIDGEIEWGELFTQAKHLNDLCPPEGDYRYYTEVAALREDMRSGAFRSSFVWHGKLNGIKSLYGISLKDAEREILIGQAPQAVKILTQIMRDRPEGFNDYTAADTLPIIWTPNDKDYNTGLDLWERKVRDMLCKQLRVERKPVLVRTVDF